MCDWLNNFYGFIHILVAYITLDIDKMDGYGISDTTCHKYLPRRPWVLATEGPPESSIKMECFSYKGEGVNA